MVWINCDQFQTSISIPAKRWVNVVSDCHHRQTKCSPRETQLRHTKRHDEWRGENNFGTLWDSLTSYYAPDQCWLTIGSLPVCATDSDVTFESCDNVLFKVHQPNLVTHSQGFAPPAGTTAMSLDSEPVHLSESAEVLELLFQYMYPQRTPDLKTVEFRVFANLAEAAEKYQVFGAMDICNTRMEYVSSTSLAHHERLTYYNPKEQSSRSTLSKCSILQLGTNISIWWLRWRTNIHFLWQQKRLNHYPPPSI